MQNRSPQRANRSLILLLVSAIAVVGLTFIVFMGVRTDPARMSGTREVALNPAHPGYPDSGAPEARSLRGEVLFDEDIDPRSVTVVLKVSQVSSTSTFKFQLDVRGEFYRADLPPGQVSADFVLGQGQEVVHSIASVPMEPGGEYSHLTVDLRGALHVFTFEVFGPYGEPAPDIVLFWRRTREGDGSAAYDNWVRGPSPRTLTVASEWVDVAIVASGARVLEVPAVSLSRSFQLREGYPVRIALPEGLQPAEDGVSLALRLEAMDPDPRFSRATKRGRKILEETAEHTFEGDTVECLVPALGIYAVRWRAYRELSEDGLEILHLEDNPGRVEVSPSSHSTLFQPYFPLELYREKLKDS